MNKSTKVISLVLMGSALSLAGCARERDDEEENRGGGGAHAGPRVIAPVGIRGGMGGGSVSSGASARGGFGGIGGVGVGT